MTDRFTRNMELKTGGHLPPGFVRIAMVVEYDGSHYRGWQEQASGVPTVQVELQKALSTVANEPITVVCAGRTDAGVHGTYQVVHFDTLAKRRERQWLLGTNTNLPLDIAVRWVGEVPGGFHARFSARRRSYRYVIYNSPVRPAISADHLTWEKKPLDVTLMQEGANYLIGEHDFSSFRAAGCQAKSPVREVQFFKVWRQGALVIFEVTANAFLHHQIRNFAGVLMRVGRGERQPAWVQEVLEARDRKQGDITAKPNGLYLVNVGYEDFDIAALHPGPHFISDDLHH